METQTLPTNEIAKIVDNSLPILRTAPDILKANEALKIKALVSGSNILQKYSENGLTFEMDSTANEYLTRVKAASKKINEDRSGVTQIMDSLKKLFTSIESDLDVKKEGTIPFQIQAHRNAYAKQVFDNQEAKRKAEQLVADRKNEAIEIKAFIEKEINSQYNGYLMAKKQSVTNAFNAITIENYEAKSAALNALNPMYSFIADVKPQYLKHHNVVEFTVFKDEISQNLTPDLVANYTAELAILKADLLDKLPSKLAELQEQKRLLDEAESLRIQAESEEKERQAKIATANQAERERLEKEQQAARLENQKKQAELKAQQEESDRKIAEREKAESDRIAKESEDAKAKSEQEIEIKKQGEQTMTMFEKEAALSELAESPEARQGFEIEILHSVAYTQIFAMWFEKVGKDLPFDKVGNTKLDQMKAWAEKEAHKTGNKIESKFFKYNPTYSAVNRKVK